MNVLQGAGLTLYQTKWKAAPIYEKTDPKLNEGNGRPLSREESVLLTVSLSNPLYKVKLIIEDMIAEEIIIGTGFLNIHVTETLGIEQRIHF